MKKDSERLIFLDDIHKEMEREISKICEKQMKIYCSRFGFTREDLLLWLEASRCDLVISFKGAKMMSIEAKRRKSYRSANMNVENRMKILKSLLLSAEKGYQLGAPYHHYVEMFNQNINDAIFYLAAIKFSEVNVESLEPTKYKLDICDNHGVHCIEVDKIEIDDLIYALDVFGVLCDLPSSEVVRLKKEITDSKDPKYLELLPNFEYFDDTGSL